MPTLTIRQVPESTYEQLKAFAALGGRSMEAEARSLLDEAMQSRTWWRRWVEATEALRGADLPIPPRSQPRGVDLP